MSYFNVSNSPYAYMMPYQSSTAYGSAATGMSIAGAQTSGQNMGISGVNAKDVEEKAGVNGIKKPSTECQTCKERKYQDGSDEMVSFKSPTHISPQNAGVAVRAHEQEHVRNAYAKASKGNGKVLSANVAIHTATCPECGRSYVSGGLTTTKIQYSDESNPYQQNKKALDHANIVGMNADYAV